MYINDTNNSEQKSYQQLKTDNPNISLPVDKTNIILDIWFYVNPSTRPTYNQYTEQVVPLTPVKAADIYFQQWQVENLSELDINENIQVAKDSQYQAIGEYSASLIDEANADPYVGSKTTAAKNKVKVSNRINHSSNGKPKSDLDKDRDDVLADHTDDIMDADDSARDIIEAMNDAQAIYDMDIPTIVVWPTWVSPA